MAAGATASHFAPDSLGITWTAPPGTAGTPGTGGITGTGSTGTAGTPGWRTHWRESMTAAPQGLGWGLKFAAGHPSHRI